MKTSRRTSSSGDLAGAERTVTLDSDADRDAMATSDKNDFQDQMQDLDGMELVDRKIIAATILGVDITEVYSLLSVAKVAKRFGMVAG